MDAIRYQVPMVRQHFSPVCWLASAVMVMQYKEGATMSVEDLAERAGLQGPDFRLPGLTVEDETPVGNDQQTVLGMLGFTGQRLDLLTTQRERARLQRGRGAHFATAAPPRQRRPLPQGPPSAPTHPGEHAIHWVLSNHGPFVLLHHVGSFSYGPNLPIPPQALGSGHAVVVTGFIPELHRVTFNNPWGQTDVPTTASSIVGAIRRWEDFSSNSQSMYWL